MTIEDILGCSASQLEAMSDVELYKYLEPYLKVTRPERVDKQENLKLSGGDKKEKTTIVHRSAEKRNRIIELGKMAGIDLEDDV